MEEEEDLSAIALAAIARLRNLADKATAAPPGAAAAPHPSAEATASGSRRPLPQLRLLGLHRTRLMRRRGSAAAAA